MNIDQSQKLDENTRLTRELHATIVGDEAYGRVGLVKEVAEMKGRLEKHERTLIKLTGTLAGLGIAWEIVRALLLKG